MDADQIIKRREALGLSRPELAHEIGVDHSSVWRWERGKRISPLARTALEAALRRLERQRDKAVAVGA